MVGVAGAGEAGSVEAAAVARVEVGAETEAEGVGKAAVAMGVREAEPGAPGAACIPARARCLHEQWQTY